MVFHFKNVILKGVWGGGNKSVQSFIAMNLLHQKIKMTLIVQKWKKMFEYPSLLRIRAFMWDKIHVYSNFRFGGRISSPCPWTYHNGWMWPLHNSPCLNTFRKSKGVRAIRELKILRIFFQWETTPTQNKLANPCSEPVLSL